MGSHPSHPPPASRTTGDPQNPLQQTRGRIPAGMLVRASHFHLDTNTTGPQVHFAPQTPRASISHPTPGGGREGRSQAGRAHPGTTCHAGGTVGKTGGVAHASPRVLPGKDAGWPRALSPSCWGGKST